MDSGRKKRRKRRLNSGEERGVGGDEWRWDRGGRGGG